MGRMRRAIVGNHFVCIAVIGGNERKTALGLHRFNDLRNTRIDRLDSGNRSGNNARMSNHIGISKIHDIYVGLIVFNRRGKRVGNSGFAHLGLQIVGRNLRARDNRTLLPLLFSLNATIQEERDMRILLGFGDMVLAQTSGRKHIGEHVFRECFRECDGGVDRRVVFRHAHEAHLRCACTHKPVKIGIDNRMRDFTGTIGTEIEEHNRIAIEHTARIEGARHHELVGYIAIVGSLHECIGGNIAARFGAYDGIEGLLHALPALIAVHRVIAPRNRSDFCHARKTFFSDELFKLLDIALAARRRHIATIHEAMDANIAHAISGRVLNERIQMLVRGMHATIGKQAHEVQRSARNLRRIERRINHGIFANGTLTACHIDSREFLVHYAASANIQMAYFGISHLARRKTHGLTRCFKLAHGGFAQKRIQIRSVREGNRIARTRLRQTEAVHNHKQGWRTQRLHSSSFPRKSAYHIAANGPRLPYSP